MGFALFTFRMMQRVLVLGEKGGGVRKMLQGHFDASAVKRYVTLNQVRFKSVILGISNVITLFTGMLLGTQNSACHHIISFSPINVRLQAGDNNCLCSLYSAMHRRHLIIRKP